MALDNLIPEVWANELLLALRNSTVYGTAGIVNRNYQGEFANQGDTVHIHSINDVTISDYTKNTDHADRKSVV